MKKIVRQKPEPTHGRATIVRRFDIPWELNYFTREEAHAHGLAGIETLSEMMGYRRYTATRWREEHEDFPKPVGRGHGEANFGYPLYSAHEVFTWTAQALKARHVRRPHKKIPS